MTFNTPILVIAYKRPNELLQVISSLSRIKPEKLYFAFDGAKNGAEIGFCQETQDKLSFVNWKCSIKTDISNKNLGCKKRVSTAIDWFFKHETEGIILEDDTLPGESFFYYCEQLLQIYRNNINIHHISGNNFLPNDWDYSGDYYFSNIPHVWGWATWRRAWKNYDAEMLDYPENFERIFSRKNVFSKPSKLMIQYYFDKTFKGQINTWDFQWFYALLKNNGKAINPRVNLVKNIGFNDSATHTNKKNQFSQSKISILNINKHPADESIDSTADRYILENNFRGTYSKVILFKLNKIIGSWYYKALLFKQYLWKSFK
jgi:hypothetical protein